MGVPVKIVVSFGFRKNMPGGYEAYVPIKKDDMFNILISGIKYSFTGFYLLKFSLHFYLDLAYDDYDILEVTTFEKRNKQALHYYKREESGRRGILKRICNICFSISIFLLVLWLMIYIAHQVGTVDARR